MSALHTCAVVAPERAKYDRLWADVPEYRQVSPGEQLVGPFLALTRMRPGERIVDVGCGPGRASLKFSQLMMYTTALDFSAGCLDPDVVTATQDDDAPIVFCEACAWHDWPTRIEPQDYAYCCDVLEHIPVEFTMVVVERCLQAAPKVFLHIAFDADVFGASIGETLHVTVRPFDWWRDRLAEMGRLVEARDFLGHGIFLLERR